MSEDAQRIVRDAFPGWEARLVATILREQLSITSDLKRDVSLRLTPSPQHVPAKRILHWAQRRTAAMEAFADSWSVLVESLNAALTAVGDDSDPRNLMYLGTRFGKVYEGILKWTLKSQSAKSETWCEGLIRQVTALSSPYIVTLEQLPDKLDAAVATASSTGEKGHVELEIELKGDALRAEIDRVARRLKLR